MYPTLLRTISSDGDTVRGIAALMKHFNWTRMAVIEQHEALFATVSTLMFSKICIIYYASDPGATSQDVKAKESIGVAIQYRGKHSEYCQESQSNTAHYNIRYVLMY